MVRCLFFLLSLALFFFACNTKQKKEIRTSFSSSSKLVKSEILNIHLDSVSSHTSLCMTLLPDGEDELLFLQNNADNSIQVYSLNERKLLKTLFIPQSGPASIAQIHGFTVSSKDSIFVYDYFTLWNTLLINFDGEIIGTFKIPHPRTGRAFNHFSLTPCPVILNNGLLYIKEIPLDIGLPNPNLYSSGYKLEYSYNLLTSELKSEDITWPVEYHGNDYWVHLNTYYKAKGENGVMVYSWQASDSILVTDFKTVKKKYFAGSRYFKKGIRPNSTNSTGHEECLYIESDQYSIIAYDKYRNLYYRFVRHGIPCINIDNQVQTAYDQPISIIILDKDFNILGETLLETGAYLTKDYFIGKEGLYLSNQNINNKDLHEDYMKFTLLKVEKS